MNKQENEVSDLIEAASRAITAAQCHEAARSTCPTHGTRQGR